jgi:hypothetical protein
MVTAEVCDGHEPPQSTSYGARLMEHCRKAHPGGLRGVNTGVHNSYLVFFSHVKHCIHCQYTCGDGSHQNPRSKRCSDSQRAGDTSDMMYRHVSLYRLYR